MTIDNKNIYTEYGCTLLEGSLDDLLRYPKRKTPEHNNWAELDGIDPDLTEVKFEAKEVRMSFLMQSVTSEEFKARYYSFIPFLSSPGYRTVSIPLLGKSYNLRLSKSPDYSQITPLSYGNVTSKFALAFIDDVPMFGDNLSPVLFKTGSGYHINGYDLASFGVYEVDMIDELLRYPDLKDPFTDGKTVDLTTIRRKNNELKLSFVLLAKSPDEFWKNYTAFFNTIAGTGTQTLYAKEWGKSIEVYYSDCPACKLIQWTDAAIAIEFTISLVAPVPVWSDSTGGKTTFVLVNEEGAYLTDENNNILAVK